jgi:2-polyprenyl-6-methoxyphenol hydroxylase-like FAD-dependent oxidoreductase
VSVTSTDSGTHPVVIAGGGPVGIGVALELASHGVRSVVIESRGQGEYFPARANLTNLRSMEHFRRWGIADRLRENDPVGDDFVRSITYITALNGHVVTDLTKIFEFSDQIPFASDRPEFAPNTGIEKTMQDAARDNPLVDIRFGATVAAFDQDDDSVRLTYTDDGGETVLSAAYLVAADGSRSQIRRGLGIRMEGHPELVQSSIWYIHAPGLREQMTVGRSSFFFFINEFRDNMFMITQDSDDHYMLGILPVRPDVDADDWASARQVLFRNVGFEFEVTPLSGGRVRVHSLLAPEFHRGRVFLAGDAAHLISPMGGFGMNLGIGDAADLGWKLAAVINGWGDSELLDSYGAERRAVIEWIQQACIGNTTRSPESFAVEGISDDTPDGAALRAKIGAAIAAVKVEEFESFGAQLGTHYQGSPIVVPDGTQAPPLTQGGYLPSASPGCRAPHVWLTEQLSLFDCFGTGYTLLITGDPAGADTAAFEAAAREREIPLDILAPEHSQIPALYQAEFVLIRPDQHVAWRGDTLPVDPGRLFDVVRGASIELMSGTAGV